MREAGLAPDGSDLHMLNHPVNCSQGFRQSPAHIPRRLLLWRLLRYWERGMGLLSGCVWLKH